MCGRFVFKIEDDFYYRYEIERLLELESNFNVAPFSNIPVITKNSPKKVELMLWGFQPKWSQTLDYKKAVINARSESLLTKPYFKDSFLNNRCIIPATGYFEWMKVNNTKIPYYFFDKVNKYLSIAGIFSEIKDKEGNIIKTCCIITTKANENIRDVHDRMPVILNKENEELWLNKQFSTNELNNCLVPYYSKSFDRILVSNKVNNPKNKNSNLIKKVKD